MQLSKRLRRNFADCSYERRFKEIDADPDVDLAGPPVQQLMLILLNFVAYELRSEDNKEYEFFIRYAD